ncbi:hypothetical protein HPB49_017085 [Dermacentor silvarum]|uniref:Uncharacterized protein n=1 Tax=Dermacentor silvarum TaxID=543639 RepID=A0ACB8CLZ0_DERSI|nr:hypothetical protein HPB49_017085 [Dermacentor silvarum]
MVAEHNSLAKMPISAPVSAAASDDIGNRQRSKRIDNVLDEHRSRAQQRKQTEDKICSLSSTSASECEMRTTAPAHVDTDPSASAATYVIIDLSTINRLLEKTKCRTCSGAVSIEDRNVMCSTRLVPFKVFTCKVRHFLFV